MVRSSTVSSKLSSGKWPRPDGVANKIIRILQQWGALRHQQRHQKPRTCSPSGDRAEASKSSDLKEGCSGSDSGGGVRAAAHNGRERETRNGKHCSGGQDTKTAAASTVISSGGELPAGQDDENHTEVGLSRPARCSTGGGPGGGGSVYGGQENGEAKHLADGASDSVDISAPQKLGRSIDAASSAGVTASSAIAPSLGPFSLSVEDVLAEVGGAVSSCP